MLSIGVGELLVIGGVLLCLVLLVVAGVVVFLMVRKNKSTGKGNTEES
jgi:hypothetical protein